MIPKIKETQQKIYETKGVKSPQKSLFSQLFYYDMDSVQ
jgi:hypothetical protein